VSALHPGRARLWLEKPNRNVAGSVDDGAPTHFRDLCLWHDDTSALLLGGLERIFDVHDGKVGNCSRGFTLFDAANAGSGTSHYLVVSHAIASHRFHHIEVESQNFLEESAGGLGVLGRVLDVVGCHGLVVSHLWIPPGGRATSLLSALDKLIESDRRRWPEAPEIYVFSGVARHWSQVVVRLLHPPLRDRSVISLVRCRRESLDSRGAKSEDSRRLEVQARDVNPTLYATPSLENGRSRRPVASRCRTSPFRKVRQQGAYFRRLARVMPKYDLFLTASRSGKMKTSPVLLLVLGCAVMVAILLALMAFMAPTPAPPAVVPACGPPPLPLNSMSVPAGQDVVLGSTGANNSNPYGGPIPQWRLSIWADSSADYNVFLLTLDQYNAFAAANGTGFNGSILHGAPSTYFWSSGAATSTNETLLMGNGTWYMLLYNPGSAEITVNLGSESCNAP